MKSYTVLEVGHEAYRTRYPADIGNPYMIVTNDAEIWGFILSRSATHLTVLARVKASKRRPHCWEKLSVYRPRIHKIQELRPC